MNDAPPPLYSAPQQQPQPTNPAPPRKSGCGWGAGCGLGCLVVVGLCVAGVIFGVVALKNWFGDVVEQYTATTGVPLEAPQASPDEVAAAIAKLDAFKDGMAAGGAPVPLELSGDELNLIMWNHPSFSEISGKANATIEGDQLRSQVSIDFSQIPIPDGFVADALEGKFFNGEVSLKLGMVAGRPALFMEGLSVNGNAVPEVFMTEMRKQNLLEEAASNPEATAFFNRIEDIRIENGQLIIVPKAAP